ncbi:MAG TPA: hypothetical protein VLW50_12300 [Streptosporangiaceae bacterium]|nr:hypothetical protein [Streptosporangiaceae bacterium]
MAGKTTLMRIVIGQELPTTGVIRVFGEIPAENDAVLRRMVFVREEHPYPDFRVRHAIRVASWFCPNWCAELARQLLADFDLPLQRRIKNLWRGMRSAVGIVIGQRRAAGAGRGHSGDRRSGRVSTGGRRRARARPGTSPRSSCPPMYVRGLAAAMEAAENRRGVQQAPPLTE